MRLGLSSSAAPRASFGELLEACARRGLATLELREGDGHGIDDLHLAAAAAAARRAEGAGVGISGYRTGRVRSARGLAMLSEALGAPVLLEGGVDPEHALERVGELVALRARFALVAAGPDAAVRAAAAAAAGADVAWDALPGDGAVDALAADVLEAAGSRLTHVTLYGGGPEAATQEGRGVGALMAGLALAGWSGDLLLAPTSSRYRVVWETWLGRRGGWGCGGAAAKADLVEVSPTAAGTGATRPGGA